MGFILDTSTLNIFVSELGLLWDTLCLVRAIALLLHWEVGNVIKKFDINKHDGAE